LPPLKLLIGELRILKPPQECIESDLTLHTRKRRPETKMGSPAKSQMAVIGTKQIQAVRIGESVWIAVCRSKDRDYFGFLVDNYPAKFHISDCNARCVLDGRFVAKQFLYRAASNFGPQAQLLETIGITQESQKAARDQVGSGLMATDQCDNGIGYDLVIGQSATVDLRRQ